MYKKETKELHKPLSWRVRHSAEASRIDSLLGYLNRYINSFRAGLALFEASERRIPEILGTGVPTPSQYDQTELLMQWQAIVARDGAVTIFNFVKCIESIKARAKASSEINAITDWSVIRETDKLVKAQFGSANTMRHGVAHSGELHKSRKEELKNVKRGSYKGHGIDISGTDEIYISENLSGNTFITGHRGKVETYEISQATLDAMIAIRDKLLRAFEKRPSDPNEIK